MILVYLHFQVESAVEQEVKNKVEGHSAAGWGKGGL